MLIYKQSLTILTVEGLRQKSNCTLSSTIYRLETSVSDSQKYSKSYTRVLAHFNRILFEIMFSAHFSNAITVKFHSRKIWNTDERLHIFFPPTCKLVTISHLCKLQVLDVVVQSTAFLIDSLQHRTYFLWFISIQYSYIAYLVASAIRGFVMTKNEWGCRIQQCPVSEGHILHLTRTLWLHANGLFEFGVTPEHSREL